jgi:hypothetical protein
MPYNSALRSLLHSVVPSGMNVPGLDMLSGSSFSMVYSTSFANALLVRHRGDKRFSQNGLFYRLRLTV